VLPGDGRPKVEVSTQTTGKLLGIDTRSMVTYTATVRSDGSLYGEGQGIVMGKNGEAATLRVAGAGRLLGGGAGTGVWIDDGRATGPGWKGGR
jgi:hypothetical protein